MPNHSRDIFLLSGLLSIAFIGPNLQAESLPHTQPLEMQGDLAMQLVEGVDQFLLNELEKSVDRRKAHWKRDLTSWNAHETSIQPQRKQLASILGVRDQRIANPTPNVIAHPGEESRIGRGNSFDIYAISWPAFGVVNGEGLLLIPTKQPAIANVVAIPDCEITPEQLVGLTEAVTPASQYARHLAEAGFRVVVPLLINRDRKQFDWGARPAPNITNREMLYRSAFELGRGLIGYEVQKVLAAVDWFQQTSSTPIGVFGWGEGGLIALYSGALDSRIDVTCVSGYFDSRQNLWQEPLDRNVFGLLEQFGDAELATMIMPRHLIIEAARGPEADFAGHGGGPARLRSPQPKSVQTEVKRAKALVHPLATDEPIQVILSDQGEGPAGSAAAVEAFAAELGATSPPSYGNQLPTQLRAELQLAARHRRQMQQIDAHNQSILKESPQVRRKFLSNLDSSNLEKYRESAQGYRDIFAEDVIGRFPYPLASPNPRSRRIYESDGWRGYEVVLDVFEGVFAYGILLIPKDLKPGERRPVVVCQHGLEGRPQDTVGIQTAHYYAGFAGKLADRGYITFSPQNLYIGQDKFRTLQRKSNPIKKTLFSTITPQHQQIVNWLKTHPNVDGDRIAFYGLSYGGKTAMRVPAIVTDYCLSICSADFNEWVDKNASTRNPRSYVWTGEYEIFEFDLGSTFNYAEMAALIAPRPFMVERGHHDGVADDWTVAWEFAKVRNLYATRLNLPDHCEIEWFNGPHQINGVGTFSFLDRHLNWNSDAGESRD